jgi:hypothetical protein
MVEDPVVVVVVVVMETTAIAQETPSSAYPQARRGRFGSLGRVVGCILIEDPPAFFPSRIMLGIHPVAIPAVRFDNIKPCVIIPVG